MPKNYSMIPYQVQMEGISASKKKRIHEISQLSSKTPFIFSTSEQQFQFDLKLPTLSEVTFIDIKIANVDMFQVEYHNKGKKKSSSSKKLNSAQIQGKEFSIKCRQEADKLKIRLMNFPNARKSKIFYIILKKAETEVQETPKKQKKEVKVSKDTKEKGKSTKEKKKKQPQSIQSKKLIFQERKKNKTAEKDKKQASPEPKQKSNHNSVQLFPQDYSYREESRQFYFEDYDLIPFNADLQETFKNVTKEWIQAQSHLENMTGICPDHKLSKRIKIKHLKGMKFCFGIFQTFEKETIGNKIKQMGGQIKQRFTDGCIMITEELKGVKAKGAKSKNQVPFIHPTYIEQCEKENQKLPFQHFIIK